MRVSLSAAGIDAAIEPSDITVTAYAAASGLSGGTPVFGAALCYWDGLHWVIADQNSAAAPTSGASFCPASDPAYPCQLSFIADETARARLGGGRERWLSFAIQPVGHNGTGVAQLVTDYVEVRVRYSHQP
ncbi:MAG: hypothetical protein ACK2U9_01195 [Anaerolineae bacterium]